MRRFLSSQICEWANLAFLDNPPSRLSKECTCPRCTVSALLLCLILSHFNVCGFMLHQQCFHQAAVVRACQHWGMAWSGAVLAGLGAPWTRWQFLEPDDRAISCSPGRTHDLPPDDLAWLWRTSSNRTVLTTVNLNSNKYFIMACRVKWSHKMLLESIPELH